MLLDLLMHLGDCSLLLVLLIHCCLLILVLGQLLCCECGCLLLQ